MELSIDGPPVADFPFATALTKWHAVKQRRLSCGTELHRVALKTDASNRTAVATASCNLAIPGKQEISHMKLTLQVRLPKNDEEPSSILPDQTECMENPLY